MHNTHTPSKVAFVIVLLKNLIGSNQQYSCCFCHLRICDVIYYRATARRGNKFVDITKKATTTTALLSGRLLFEGKLQLPRMMSRLCALSLLLLGSCHVFDVKAGSPVPHLIILQYTYIQLVAICIFLIFLAVNKRRFILFASVILILCILYRENQCAHIIEDVLLLHTQCFVNFELDNEMKLHLLLLAILSAYAIGLCCSPPSQCLLSRNCRILV